MTEWRPIEDAPADKQVLVRMPPDGLKTLGKYQVGIKKKAMNSYVWVIGGHFAWDAGMPTEYKEIEDD